MLTNAIPILKKDQINYIGNYRPISLLSCMSKIFESYINILGTLFGTASSYEKKTTKTALLLVIIYLSKRIKELRELVVKRKIHLESPVKLVDGDW